MSREDEKASVSHGPTLIGQKTPAESRNPPFPSMSRLQRPAPLPSTVSWCLLKLTSLESVMPSAYISLLQKLTLVSSVTSIICFFSTPVTSASLYYFNPNGFFIFAPLLFFQLKLNVELHSFKHLSFNKTFKALKSLLICSPQILIFYSFTITLKGFLDGSDGKESACHVGYPGLIPG